MPSAQHDRFQRHQKESQSHDSAQLNRSREIHRGELIAEPKFIQ
jgi:hypothetical protein